MIKGKKKPQSEEAKESLDPDADRTQVLALLGKKLYRTIVNKGFNGKNIRHARTTR